MISTSNRLAGKPASVSVLMIFCDSQLSFSCAGEMLIDRVSAGFQSRAAANSPGRARLVRSPVTATWSAPCAARSASNASSRMAPARLQSQPR